MKNFVSLITSILFLLITGSLISVASGISPMVIIPTIGILSYVIQPMPGVLMFTLASIAKPTGDNNGGTKKFFFMAERNKFLLLKALKTTTNPGDQVTIDGTHTFIAPVAPVTAEGFVKIYTTEDTGEAMAESIGSPDGYSKKVSFKAFHPGTYKEFSEWERNAKNGEFILLVPTANGKYIQIGLDGLEATVKGAWKGSKLSGDGSGWEIESWAYANSVNFYEGTITEKAF